MLPSRPQQRGQEGSGDSNGNNGSVPSFFFNWSGGGGGGVGVDDFRIGAAGGHTLSPSPTPPTPPLSSCFSFSQPQARRHQRDDDSSMMTMTKQRTKKQKTMLSSFFSNPFQNNNNDNNAARGTTSSNVVHEDDEIDDNDDGVHTIARAFNQLSTQEREDALDDVHGIVNDHYDDQYSSNEEVGDFYGGGGGGVNMKKSTNSGRIGGDISSHNEKTIQKEQTVNNSDLESNPSQLQHVLQMMDYELVKQSLGGGSTTSSSSTTNAMSSSPLPPSKNSHHLNNNNDNNSIPSFTRNTGSDRSNPDNGYRNNAYLLALQQKPEYVDDVEFRIQFLRAEKYNPILAATRMISFLDIKLELFGKELLTKKYITLADMNEDDISALNSGFIQIIPLKDRSGRYICMAIPSMFDPSRSKSYLRAIFYSFMTIAQNGDVKAQKRGLVQISYSLQRSMPLSPLEMFKIFRLRSSFPVRIAAHHICGNSPIQLILSVLKRALPATALCRLQIHLGTSIEVIYRLMGFGIPISVLPLSCNGELKRDHHEAWVSERRQIEWNMQVSSPGKATTTSPVHDAADAMDAVDDLALQVGSPWGLQISTINSKNEMAEMGGESRIYPNTSISSPSPTAFVNTSAVSSSTASMNQAPIAASEPTKYDVIVGRGKNIDAHPGNVQFRNLLREKYMEEYEKAPKFRKTELAERIIRHLTDSNIRFLQKNVTSEKDAGGNGMVDGEQWIEVDFSTIREKIGRTFRRLRESEKQKSKRQS